MRLTLRTLLAYLNDTLEPTQSKEIGKKVNESDYASTLVKRIQKVVRKRRLTAPELSGPDVGLGPNTVAEYLDNALKPEDVTKVERFCLESDLHLAELASVDQIRTLALCEPVDVQAATKQRMYELVPNSITIDETVNDPTDTEQDTIVVHERKEVPTIGSTRTQPERATVPEFPTTPIWKRLLPYACVLLIGGGWLYLMVTDYGRSNEQPIADNGHQAKDALLAQNNPIANGDLTADPVNGSSRPLVTLETPVEGSNNPTPVKPTEVQEPLIELAPDPGSVAATDSTEIPEPETIAGNNTQPDENMDASAQPVPDPKDPNAPNAPPAPTVISDVDTMAQSMRPSLPGLEANAADAPDLKHREDSGILLGVDRESGEWLTRSPGSTIKTWDRFAVPEPYRSRLEPADAGIRFDVLGGSNAQYLGESKSAPYGLYLQQGRVVLTGTADLDENASKSVSIASRGRIWQIELMTPDTTCGIEIVPQLPNQFEVPPAGVGFEGTVYVAEGSVRIIDSAGETMLVKKLDSQSLLNADKDPEAPQSIRTVPDWVAAETPTVSSATRKYARLFEKEFTVGRPVVTGISPRVQDRKPQLAELAAKCLATIGDSESMLRALAETEHEESRQAAIDGLRNFLTVSADNGAIVKQQLQEFFHDDVRDDVYRLLWGFNAEDARSSETSRELVLWLDDDDVAVRQMAFGYIRELTGKTNQYSPMRTAAQRNRSYRNWLRQIEKDGALLSE